MANYGVRAADGKAVKEEQRRSSGENATNDN